MIRMVGPLVSLAAMVILAMSGPTAGAEADMIQQDWMQQDGRGAREGGKDEYLRGRRLRRRKRLGRLLASVPAIVFLENTEFGNAPRLNMSLSDGPYNGNPFRAGAAIRILRFGAAGEAVAADLLRDPGGMIRDLDVSFDGKRILFSWKKSRGDDFHIHEMVVASRAVRQVTREPGVADIQGRYLSRSRLLYHSTRCVNVVDCNESIDVVNLYTCDLDGKEIKRLAFDQVSTQYPSVLPDGRIVYTRWDYNDRGQIYPQGLFTMNPDGTQQRALYGNNSWYPTSLVQARAMPGTQTLLAIASGHHTPPCGKLVTVDVSVGTEEGKGIALLAPEREPKPKRVDKAEQEGALFQYPYPLTKDEYLTGYSLLGRKRSSHFAIYWMNRAGERELLCWDPKKSYRHPLPLVPRAIPPERPSTVDPEKDNGTFYVDDIYFGEGLSGIPRGTIKRLRVIGLEFRAAAVGRSHNRGEGGRARVCTPVSLSGAWDVKRVLGEAKVHEDGSAFFHVPSRMAVYFQAIDGKGHVVQSMRSWATLQPGESFSCMGCHEGKGYAPPVTAQASQAMRAGPQKLRPFHGPARGFSFPREVQPILDRHCVACHKGRVYTPGFRGSGKESFSLTGRPVRDAEAKRAWTESYVSLLQAAKSRDGKGVNPYVKSNSFINWISPQSGPTVLKPYSFGAARSAMIDMLSRGHPDAKSNDKPRVRLSRGELEIIACWIDLAVPFCGDYREAGTWSQKEKDWYQHQLDKQERLRTTLAKPGHH